MPAFFTKNAKGFIPLSYLILGLVLLCIVAGGSYYLGLKRGDNVSRGSFENDLISGPQQYKSTTLQYINRFGFSFYYPNNWVSTNNGEEDWVFAKDGIQVLTLKETDKQIAQVSGRMPFETIQINGRTILKNLNMFLIPLGTKSSRTVTLQFYSVDEKIVSEVVHSLSFDTYADIDAEYLWNKYSDPKMKLLIGYPSGVVSVVPNEGNPYKVEVKNISKEASSLKDTMMFRFTFYPQVREGAESFGRKYLSQKAGRELTDLDISSICKIIQNKRWCSINLVDSKNSGPSFSDIKLMNPDQTTDFVEQNGGIVLIEENKSTNNNLRYFREDLPTNLSPLLIEKIKDAIRFSN